MEENTVLEKRRGQIVPISQIVLKVMFTIPCRNQEEMVGISQQRGLTLDKIGMEEMKVGTIKGNFKIPSMTLRIRRMRKVIQKIPVS